MSGWARDHKYVMYICVYTHECEVKWTSVWLSKIKIKQAKKQSKLSRSEDPIFICSKTPTLNFPLLYTKGRPVGFLASILWIYSRKSIGREGIIVFKFYFAKFIYWKFFVEGFHFKWW